MSNPKDSTTSCLQSGWRDRASVDESIAPEAEKLLKRLWDDSCSLPPDDADLPLDEPVADRPREVVQNPIDVTAVIQDLIQRSQQDSEAASSPLHPKRQQATRLSTSEAPSDDLLRTINRLGRAQASLKRLPDVGDTVFGFRLCRELGRGAFARVFLAQQEQLAERPVVVKLSPIEGKEPQTLAQLQHTHIVPIYSVHEDPEIGLRAVCMPFLGTASLSQVLRDLWETIKLPKDGRQFVESLERVEPISTQPAKNRSRALYAVTPDADEETRSLTPRQYLQSLSYVEASVWIVARLAEGLSHAHDRGVLHRDIKPSNVLISSEGQPLLLDFNLAQEEIEAAAAATVGGTVSYMAPEHLEAVSGRTNELARRVDHRSDIYSLGMLLFEMLVGQRPFDQSGSYSAMLLQIKTMAAERSQVTPSLRSQRADVPWSLESILRKCLAPEPGRRYQRAEHLAEDLRRFLENRPLKFAPELSWVERVQKWTRRHPRLTYSCGVASIAAVALLVVGTALTSVYGRLTNTRQQLHTIQAKDRRELFEKGTLRALCLVNTAVPLTDYVRDGITACEETLNLYGFLGTDTWREPMDWSELQAAERQRLAENTRELLMLLAAARVQIGPHERSTWEGALSLLDRAAMVPGLQPSKALWLDRSRYLNRLGETAAALAAAQTAERHPATTARDHYLLATAYAREGGHLGFRKALKELDEAIRLDPRHYWSWTQRGFCHFELGEHLLAAADFGHCTGLWPDFAWGYFNRGRVLDQSGKKQEAAQDYSAAIECDPEFAAAYVNRGLAYLELRQYSEAYSDFSRSLEFGRSDATLYASCGMALEGLGRHEEADAAFKMAFAQAGRLVGAERVRLGWAYGFSISARLPEEARLAFLETLAEETDNQQALYGLAMLSMNQSDNAAALSYFNQALEAHPEFMEARRYRAILLARIGLLDRASEDINYCLEKEPTVGATLYAAACVASRAAERISDPQVSLQAIDLLRRALAVGVDPEKAKADPDLKAIRQHPSFSELFQNPSSTFSLKD